MLFTVVTDVEVEVSAISAFRIGQEGIVEGGAGNMFRPAHEFITLRILTVGVFATLVLMFNEESQIVRPTREVWCLQEQIRLIVDNSLVAIEKERFFSISDKPKNQDRIKQLIAPGKVSCGRCSKTAY